MSFHDDATPNPLEESLVTRRRSQSWADPSDNILINVASRRVRVIGYAPDLEPLLNASKSSNALPSLGEEYELVFGEPSLRPHSPKETPLVRIFVRGKQDEEAKEPRMRCSDAFRAGSVRGSVFNLCSATLGAGALSLPFAFSQSGLVPGTLLLILGALATIYSIRLLIRARSITHYHSYEDLTVHLFGRRMGYFVEMNIIVFCFGTAVAYTVAVGDILQPVLHVVGAPAWLTRRFAMVAFWLVVMFPLSLIEKMNDLRFTSLFGVMAILYLVIATGLHSVTGAVNHWDSTWGAVNLLPALTMDGFMGLVKAMPIIMFAFTCQVNVFSIYDELEHASPRRMGRVTHGAIAVCFAVYICMGAFGVLNFGPAVQGNVLKNYCLESSRDPVIVMAFAAITLTVLMAYPLVIFPCRYATDVMLFRSHHHDDDDDAAAAGAPLSASPSGGSGGGVDLRPTNATSWLRHVLLTFLISGSSLMVALYVPTISVVFQLMGGTTSAFVCFVLPAAFAVKLGMARTTVAVTDSITDEVRAQSLFGANDAAASDASLMRNFAVSVPDSSFGTGDLGDGGSAARVESGSGIGVAVTPTPSPGSSGHARAVARRLADSSRSRGGTGVSESSNTPYALPLSSALPRRRTNYLACFGIWGLLIGGILIGTLSTAVTIYGIVHPIPAVPPQCGA